MNNDICIIRTRKIVPANVKRLLAVLSKYHYESYGISKMNNEKHVRLLIAFTDPGEGSKFLDEYNKLGLI